MMDRLSRLIDKVNDWCGHPATSFGAVLVCLVDIAWGWRLGWSSNWISGNSAGTGFLAIILLFFLQHSTNRGNRALHAKLDAQIAKDQDLDNRLIGSEQLPAVEIKRLQAQATEQVKEAVEEAINDEEAEALAGRE